MARIALLLLSRSFIISFDWKLLFLTIAVNQDVFLYFICSFDAEIVEL